MPESKNSDEVSKIAAIAVSQYLPDPRQELVALMQEGMSGDELRPYLSTDKWREAERIYSRCRDLGIEVLPVQSARYPSRLEQVPAPPPVLYARSEVREWSPPDAMLAVVGTRAASVEVCSFAASLAGELHSAGFAVVSGLALGIDGAAHRGALLAGVGRGERGCATIAVLAHGLDKIYPPTHEPLAGQILSRGGALLSEYPPGTSAYKHHFLARNRIIAGMCQGVVVVQAGRRSGSLVTARFAADFGRDVFIYQAPEADERHSGGAEMIEDGAIPFTEAKRVLAEYGITFQSKAAELDGAASEHEMSVDEFLELHALTPSQLLKLELEEKVVRLPGNRLRVKASPI